MHVEKKYRKLENIEEIRVYNIDKNKMFHKVKQFKKIDNVRFNNIMRHVPSDINVFTPIEDSDDYLVERIGWNMLGRLNIRPDEVEGRLFSECS